MFEIKTISDPIAERRLHLEGQPDKIIRVVLGKPLRLPSPSPGVDDSAFCPYQITGIGDEKVRTAGGVDEVQALQLAMSMIGADLNFSLNRKCGGKIRWEAGTDGDLGFPVPPGVEDEKNRGF